MQLPEYFQRIAAYHAWATELLIGTHIAVLSEDDYRKPAGLFFGSVHATLNHLLVAETVWQARFIDSESPRIALDAELEPDRKALADKLLAAANRWTVWLSGLDPARLDGELHYTRNNGAAVTLPFAETLGHIFNHGTHHRGQITAALTAMGRECPELDWVRMLQSETKA